VAHDDWLGARHRRRVREPVSVNEVNESDNAERMRGVVWVQPSVVVEVSYSEVMQGRLRDPVLRRIVP
jgi:hypothetical protein